MSCEVALSFALGVSHMTGYPLLTQLSCLPLPEKMCCVLPSSADTVGESPPGTLNASNQSRGTFACCPAWKPLLLIVPLRLGINQINPVYVDAFKVSHPVSQAQSAARPSHRHVSTEIREQQSTSELRILHSLSL